MPTSSTARPWLKHYDYWVPHHVAYPKRPLTDILDTSAVVVPDRPATAFFGATLTFQELKDRSDRLAIALGALALGKGDRVGIMLPNCPQYIVAAFAILRHGAIVVNINPTYTPREVITIANDSGIRVLITLDALAPLVTAARAQTSIKHVIVTSLAEYTPAQAPPPRIEHTHSFTELLQGVTTAQPIRVPVGPEDLAVLQYTGGTTGAPKGAMLTHANIFANVVQSQLFMMSSLERGAERYLLVIPYFHIYALTVGMMKGVWVGALQIMLPKYDVDQVLSAIREYRPTYFPAVPTVFVSLLNHPRMKEFGLDKVRFFNTGGAPCPTEVIDRWERATGRMLHEGYGLSETSPVTHSTPQLAIRKPGTIGIPVPDTDVKVVDLETGSNELAIGEIGELCVRGPQVMRGYWQRLEETERALRTHADGHIWFHTGDVARLDEDGFCTIVQRKKDMIIVDGFNVYPSEVETVLYMHPDVRLVAVIGMPDSYHGEVVKACVVLREGAATTAADLITYCKSELAPYKVPTLVELRNDLPMSAVGKILYRVLRDELTPAAAKPGV